MVKRRDPKVILQNSLDEKIAEFVEGSEDKQISKAPVMNQNAIRDYKAIRVPFNEYEYQQLEKACHLSGRTKLNFIRYAMLKLAKEMQE